MTIEIENLAAQLTDTDELQEARAWCAAHPPQGVGFIYYED